MTPRLFVVHGSHPCATVEAALRLKGMEYKVVEYPPPFHMPAQRVLFGSRTVPGLRLDSGEKVQGSRAILRRLDELVPEPALLPADPAARARVLDAEAWGDEVLQPVARRILWPALARAPHAMVGFQEGGRLPPLPAPVVKAMAPVITRAERRVNAASDEAVQDDLRALPAHLDRIDAWIADGVLGGEQPNAADLQIAASVRLLLTVADVRPVFAGRPAADLPGRLFPPQAGEVPSGTYPAEWLPATPTRV